MKIKTSELKGAALDWAVAKCEGVTVDMSSFRITREGGPAEVVWTCSVVSADTPSDDDDDHCFYCDRGGETVDFYTPSTSWTQAGPIIEREGISIDQCFSAGRTDGDEEVYATIANPKPKCLNEQIVASGTTPLIAAMRCYCASKLGDEVEVPVEVCRETNA